MEGGEKGERGGEWGREREREWEMKSVRFR